MLRAIVAITLAGTAAACGDGGDDLLDELRETFPSPTACPANFVVEIESVRETFQIDEGNGVISAADQGENFVVIAAELRSDSAEPVRVDAGDVDLVDKNDRRYSWVLAGDEPELEGTINPGDTLRGVKVWSVPLSATEAWLVHPCSDRKRIEL